MELWIAATLVAATFQTVRFMLHKVLSLGALGTSGSTFARFAYAAPFAALTVAAYILATEAPLPAIGADFVPYAVAGALGQIAATACVVALFDTRNFAVGITFKKTEVVLTALAGWLILGEALSPAGWGAILLGVIGVVVLSGTPDGRSFRAGLASRATALGLASGVGFAISAVGYRGASLALDSPDPLLRAGLTLAAVTLFQTVVMGIWLALRTPGRLSAVWAARHQAVWLGLMSMAGSLGWFTAFTLQTAAYVQALGQVELMLSIAASTLFFRERIAARELAGMALITLSILTLIAVR